MFKVYGFTVALRGRKLGLGRGEAVYIRLCGEDGGSGEFLVDEFVSARWSQARTHLCNSAPAPAPAPVALARSAQTYVT